VSPLWRLHKSKTVVFNVIFSLICDLPSTRVVEKRGLARQQHYVGPIRHGDASAVLKQPSRKIQTLTMLMQAAF